MSYIRVIGDPPRRSNAQLMADCAQLGLLDGSVLDLTYNVGRFWRDHRPADLTTSDLDLQFDCDYHENFCATRWDANSFDTVVLDAPYKLNGTSTGLGPAASDESYGVGGSYSKVEATHDLMLRGLVESARLARRWVLFKCMDQVVSGQVQWQTRMFADYGEKIGMRLWNRMYVVGYRKQSRPQVHVHADHSTLLIFQLP